MLRLCLLAGLVLLWFRPGDVFAVSQVASSSTDFTQHQDARIKDNVVRTNVGLMPIRRSQDAYFFSRPQVIPLTQRGPFFTLTPVAEFTHYQASKVEISLRFSPDGQTWTAWEPVGACEDLHQVEGRFIGNMRYLDSTYAFFEYAVWFAENTQAIEPVQLRHLRFDFFNPGYLAPVFPRDHKSADTRSDASCSCDQPVHAKRQDWDCPDGASPSCSLPEFTQVTHMVVHHSAGPNSSPSWPAVVLAIWNLHVNTNGWCDIGYNWIIDPNGVIYEGRGGGNNVKGAHFCGANSGTMGVCLLGNYEEQPPTLAALEALRRLLTWKSCDASLNPVGQGLHAASGLLLPTIASHQDGCATLCPGQQLLQALNPLRPVVDSSLQACSGPIANLPEARHQAGLRVFPNPNGGDFQLSWEALRPERYQLQILDAVGRRLWQEEFQMGSGEQTYRPQVPGLPQGVYRVRLSSPSHQATEALVIR